MMKRLFILLLILCSLQAFSQPVTTYLGTPTTSVLTRGAHRFGTFAYLPGVVAATPDSAGAIRYYGPTQRAQLWTGLGWIDIGTSVDSFTYATRRYVDSSTAVFGSRLYDTYNTSDTLTASRTVTLGSYQVRFYKDPTSYVIINPAYLSAIYKSASDANQTSTFQAAPYYSFLKNSYVMGGTTANAFISTEANPDARRVLLEYNRGASIVNQAYVDEDGFHVQNKDSVGFAVDTDGLISIDTLPAGSGVQVLWDSVGKKLAYGSGGGGSSYTPTITTASTSQTLSTDYETWVFTGSSAATFTLPAISGDTGRRFFIKNEGSANLTVQRAGTDQLYTSSLVNSITILPGGSYLVQNNGTRWSVLF